MSSVKAEVMSSPESSVPTVGKSVRRYTKKLEKKTRKASKCELPRFVFFFSLAMQRNVSSRLLIGKWGFAILGL